MTGEARCVETGVLACEAIEHGVPRVCIYETARTALDRIPIAVWIQSGSNLGRSNRRCRLDSGDAEISVVPDPWWPLANLRSTSQWEKKTVAQRTKGIMADSIRNSPILVIAGLPFPFWGGVGEERANHGCEERYSFSFVCVTNRSAD